MKRLWCRIVGHQWERLGFAFGYASAWGCARCEAGCVTPPGVEPKR